MRLNWFLLVLLPLAPLANGSAQQRQPIPPGARVRLTAADLGIHQFVGTFVALGPDTLVIDSLRVPFATVTRLEVMQRKSRAGRGALIGAGAGAAAGLMVALASCGSNDCYLDGSNLTAVVALVLGGGGALVGGGVGALIGSRTKVDRWEQMPLDRLRVSVGLRPNDRFRLGIALRF